MDSKFKEKQGFNIIISSGRTTESALR